MPNRFNFDDKGIGDLLREGRLKVPPNQRSYAWQERHVQNFLEDLNESLRNGDADYFLGTIVLVQKEREVPSIADGQQRLATTSIALARIRDILFQLGREPSARSIDTDFLRTIDRRTEALSPRLTLNLEDHEFFSRAILVSPIDQNFDPNAEVAAGRSSNTRLRTASDLCDAFFRHAIERLPEGFRADHLLEWVDHLQSQVGVIIVTVPDEVGAYRMFETLNDRGLKASQADILKNYFYSRSPNRLDEVAASWNSIGAAVEVLPGDENERLITYLRHLWITNNGPTKERELAAAIRSSVTSENRTVSFLSDASSAVQDYLALWSSRHPKWDRYPPSVRQNIETLAAQLQVEQIRPLLFAVARHFTPEEAEKAFRLFVSWSVRFLVYGGRGGLLDTQYSQRAHDVGRGTITRARELREAMREYVPTDTAFKQAFSTARVSRSHLARYYLRAIEKKRQNDPQPEYVPNEQVADINLEHVLPMTPGAEWGVDLETARSAQKMLGNMALLREAQNRDLGNASFAEKKLVYAASGYHSTSEIAQYERWTMTEILERQRRLADTAVATWPLTLED